MSAVSLTDWLPADQGPWHLDFEQWPQAQAQRWRAVLAVGEQGRRVLLAERDEDALLLQSIEARLNAPVGWQRCSGEAVTHFLGAGRPISARCRTSRKPLPRWKTTPRSCLPWP